MTTRNLQITIFESAGAPRSGRPGRPGAPGLDPEGYPVMPPPEDPEGYPVMSPPEDPEGYPVMPPPEDPEGYPVMPPPEDPRGGFAGFPGAVPAGPLVSARYLPAGGFAPGQAPVCCCPPCDDTRRRTPEKPGVTPRDYSGFLIVRLAPGVAPLTVDSLWELAEAAGLDGLRSVLELSLDEEGVTEEPPEDEGGERGRGRGRGRGPFKRWWREKWRQEPEEERPPEPEGVLVSRPLVNVPGRDRKATLWAVRKLEEKAARTFLRPRYSLTRYWRVDLRPYSELVDEVLARFNDLAEVDLAYRELRALDTAVHQGASTGESLAEDQSYFDPAPVGIGAGWVQRHLQDVEEPHLRVVDLEQGWHPGHEELAELPQSPQELFVYGENRDDDEPGAGNHGTAVLGQLAAAGVGPLGLRGSATTIAGFQLASHYRERLEEGEEPDRDNPFPGTNGHVAAAIVNCLVEQPVVDETSDEIFRRPLETGDVLLLEIQRGRLPTEIDEADFDAIRLATALGIIVVEAAGNGNFNLDRCIDPQTGRTLRRGARGFADSGAILVGASMAALPHDRAPFSNYGSRVDCYGWGEGVTTSGYGDLAGDETTNFYTNTFNGTSSAAPIIAGAAALLQCLHIRRTTHRLRPAPMRALLARRTTGTPQGANVGGHIGVMPDLDAITRGTLQLVPDVYVRRHPSDDGSPLGPDEEISSSPDIVVLGSSSGEPDLGQGSPSAHHPAPGENRTDGGRVYVRLRNRGLAQGRADVLLYASPTATLIPPEGWDPLGTVTVEAVSPGDRLQASDAVSWQPGAFPSPELERLGGDGPEPAWPPDAVRAYSFLAVFDRDGDPPPDPVRALPPGPPYFDWRRYREFLRGPGVSWRNVHPIGEGAGASLAFSLAGAPDRTREFDLEVIQRLPAGAAVALHVPAALAARLHQRQPALAPARPQGGARGGLTLPQRRSTRFSRVRLPEGLCAPARFEVTTSGQDLAEGHSLAIRQLWRGEEVGRITWYVTAGVP